MRQKSLQAKLQQSVSLVIVITLLASYMMAIFLVYNQTSASMREEIEKEADYLAAAVSITGEEHLEDLDTAFPDTRITLIDREGTVIYDTDQYEITFVNHLDRPEVVSAAGKGRGSDVRRSDSLGEEMYYYAILLEDGNILRISRAADTALRTAVHILPIVLIIGAGLMLIGLLLTRRRLISLIDPINRIDLNEPMENDIYIELTPLLVRIDQQNKEKEELAQIRQEFSANVSHELRTPLTSISGYAEIIKNGIVRDRDIPEFADRIYREAQRMIALIEDIMRLSKLDEGALVQKEQVDLYAVADEVRGRLEHAAADRNIRLSLQGVHCRMRGFRQILDEMIYNLVDNAIKYNKERGSVLIQVNPQGPVHRKTRCHDPSGLGPGRQYAGERNGYADSVPAGGSGRRSCAGGCPGLKPGIVCIIMDGVLFPAAAEPEKGREDGDQRIYAGGDPGFHPISAGDL